MPLTPEAGASVPDAASDAASDASTDAPTDAPTDARTDAPGDASASDAADASDGAPLVLPADIYDPSFVPRFDLAFDAAALAVLSSTAIADQKKYVHGSFTYDGVTVADVGVRRKGSSTFRAYPKKMALKIKVDRYVPNQRFRGLTDLTLNNMVSDPTSLAERLAYHVFRSAGLPAQKANNAEVYINGANFGVYMNLETPDADFLERVFPGTWKSLYESNYGSTWVPGIEDGFEEDVGDGTKADLALLFDAVKNAQPATLVADVTPWLATTQWLKFSALEAITGHSDGYGFAYNGSHNYYLAGSTTGVFSLIPWSTDVCFTDNVTVVDAAQPRPADFAAGGDTLLVRCKASTTCWPDYTAQVSAMLTAYEGLDLAALALAWHTQINGLVVATPPAKKEYSDAYYQNETTKLYSWIKARPAKIRTQLGLP